MSDLYDESARAYDAMAQTYGLNDGEETLDENLLNFFLDSLPDGPLRILDLGSGPGQYARRFAELGHEVLAVDNSPEMLQEMERRGRPTAVSPLLADMRHLDLPPRSIDAVWASAALIHLIAADLEVGLGRIYAATVPGAVMMANFAVSDLGLRHERVGEDRYATGGRFFQHYAHPDEPLSCLRQTGFTVIDTYEKVVRPQIADGTVRGHIRWVNVLASRDS